MQYRRLAYALLFLLLLCVIPRAGYAQASTYHLHQETSAITPGANQLLVAGPDVPSAAFTIPLNGKTAGEYLIKEFETQAGDPNSPGSIPAGSTLTFSLFMKKSAGVGTVFPRAKVRLNGAAGALLCTATGTAALTTTLAKKSLSCTTTTDIAMSANDRFYLWVGVNLTATSTTAFNGELDIEGTANGNFDSQMVVPLATPAPSISSLAPNTGSVGAVVVISGANFRSAQGTSTVTFNGTAATLAKATDWTATSITVPVPAAATTGPVVVTVGGQASPGVNFSVTAAPHIDSLAPNRGAVGSVVYILGSNFGPTQGNGLVTFSGKKPAITSWSPTKIVLTVPSGTTSGNVTVTAAGGIASNAVAFTVTPAPAITSLTPATGGFGSSFTIAGTNFGLTQGSGVVTLNGVPCAVTSWSDTSIVAQVPNGVTTGDVVVTAAGGVSSNGLRFQVLNPGGVAVDQIVFTTATGAATTRATAAFTTTSTNELLLAFVATSRSTAANPVVNSISGGGLTWVLVQRTNVQQGTSEIWRAFSPAVLTNIKVTATLSQSVTASLTVVTFTGVDSTGTNGSGAVGATASANAAVGAPTATLVTTRPNSAVFGVGNDPVGRVSRTPDVNQSIVDQLLCTVAQSCTMWVQQAPTLIPASGTTVTIDDTAPAVDAYNLSLVEVRPPAPAIPTITSLTPTSGPVGTVVTIAGSNFGATLGASTVTFGGVTAIPTSWSDSTILVPVPGGAPLGPVPVVVTVPGVGSSNPATFTVVNALALAVLAAPPANANAWNNTNVTISYLCSGGVPPVQCPGSVTVTTEGANQIFTATATDANGNIASASVTLNIDKTIPGITASVVPVPGPNGVVTAPATVTFTCSDGLSGVANCPPPVSVTTAGANESFNGTATDRAGNSSSASVTLNVQLAALAVSASAAPPANAAAWNNTDVTVSFLCSGGVPPLQCPGTQTLTQEGANQVVNGTVTDAAGQSASASVTVNLDKTPPVINGTVTPAPGADGIVHAASAIVNFTCSDNLSGVVDCPSPVTVTATGFQTVNGSATDNAGNTANTNVSFTLQPFAALSVVASASPAPNAAGWNNTPVTVSFICTGGAPPVSCPGPQTVSADGANQVISGTATDALGNSAVASVTINLDQTPPLVSITSPADGSVSSSANVSVQGLTSDGLSGVAAVSCNGTAATLSGGSFTCSVQITQGALSVSVQATDVAGNTATATIGVNLQGPKVTITSPAALDLFSTSTITVTGTVDDPNAVITVNGVPATNGGGNFNAQGVILREGNNLVTATATNTGGAAGTASVNVVLDTTPPTVRIDSPSNGAVLTSTEIYVTGLVNDIVTGTVNNPEVKVTINGVTADVGNRSFMADGVLLVPGPNVLTAVAKDKAGNISQSQITVTLQDASNQQRILMVSGNGQSGAAGTTLAQPFVVQVVNSSGQFMPNVPVTFSVSKSDGQISAFPQQGRQIVVQTDGNGQASTSLQLGTRVGNGNNQVLVTSPGFVGEVMFCASATVGPAAQIHDISGTSQKGVIGQPLPEPLVVGVVDAGGNPVTGVPVSFTVTQGGGTLEGSSTVTKNTNLDGRAATVLVLAQQEGVNNNVVTASFAGFTGSPASFVSSGVSQKSPVNTTVSGLVLDDANHPIPNATASIKGTNLTALTDNAGKFTIANAPVGSIDLFVDGSTSTDSESYPFLEFPMVTVAGQDNTLGSPIYLPALDTDNSQIIGGDEDVTLTMKGVPGVKFTVFAHSATFPDGSKVGRLLVSQVHSDKVPMVPPGATAPALMWTVQPPRVKFNPPIRVELPNTNGLPAGTVTETFCYNHDLEQFVSGGTARVSEDGSKVVSDPGFGLIVSGWGGSPPPPPPPTCADGCKSDTCFTSTCVNGACQKTPINEGGNCGGGNQQCGEGVCKDGACVADSDGQPCTPDDKCLEDPGKCEGGKCTGEKKELKEHKEVLGFEVEFPEALVEKLNDFLHFIPGLGGVNFEEGSFTPKSESKDCCSQDKGFIEEGEKSGSGELELTAHLRDIPLFGLGFAQRLSFRFPGVSGFIAVVAGLAFTTDFAVHAEAGHRTNECEANKDCFFGSADAAIQPGFKLTLTNIDCITISGFFSDTTICSTTEITPASIEGSVKVGARYHVPNCDTGLQGFISMGNIIIKIRVKIPGFPELKFTISPPGFQGVTCSLPGGCHLN